MLQTHPPKEVMSLNAIIEPSLKFPRKYVRVLLPLSTPCERELIQSHLFDTSKLSLGLESGLECEFPDAMPERPSCIDLLPDDPMQPIDTSATSLLLRKSYVLIGSDLFEEISHEPFCERASGGNAENPRKELGFYLVQYSEMSEALKSGHPELHSEGGGGRQVGDDEVLMHILKGHMDGLSESEGKPDASGKKGGPSDIPILSTVCRWRSCLSESCQDSGSSYLCLYHHKLKRFVDGEDTPGKSKKSAAGAPKESSKYISKKSLVHYSADTANRDLKMMRSASTLIQELWDGKLQATVKSFAQKTCLDIGLRKRLEMSHKNCQKHATKLLLGERQQRMVIPERPGWARWRNEKEFERVGSLIGSAHNILQTIISIEREIFRELEIMAGLKIFPSPELVILRKETKTFRDTHGRLQSDVTANEETGEDEGNKPVDAPLEAELSFCNRKLAIFRSRRLDAEEARAHQKKKAAKMKMLHDTQAKDPSNFANQTRF